MRKKIERYEAMVYKIGQRIADIQKSLNVSRDAMARILGITTEHYKKICAGKYDVSLDKLFVLILEYKVRVQYLLFGDLRNGMFYGEGEEPVIGDYSWLSIRGIEPTELKDRFDGLLDEFELLRSYIE